MASMSAQHHDAVNTAMENVSPAAIVPAPALALAMPLNVNQHSRAGGHTHEMSWEITQGESFVAGDSHCLTLRYHGDGFDAVFSVHGGAGGVFKHARLFVARHNGTEDQGPITRIFLMGLSERVHNWMHDFTALIMERMAGEMSGQLYDAISTFCVAVCRNFIPPPTKINCHTTGRSTSITDLPLDCIRQIRDRLDALSTLIFPLVCDAWAKVYAENRRLRPGAPTLLSSPSVEGDVDWEHPDEGYRSIFFIQNITFPRETFFVEVDDFRHSRWIGGKNEWLVAAGTHERQRHSSVLLNPITGACIHFPWLMLEDGRVWYDIKRVQLCRTPDEANGHFAIDISPFRLAYNVAGSDQLFFLENPTMSYYMKYTDAILHTGEIMAICSNGELWSWDLDKKGGNPKLLYRNTNYSERSHLEWRDFILAPSLNNVNLLVVSPYGEHIMCHRQARKTFRNQWNVDVHGADIYEVDIDAAGEEDVHDIIDQALFLGPNYPFYVRVSKPNGDLKANQYIADITDVDVVAIDLSKETLSDGKGTFINYRVPSTYQDNLPRGRVTFLNYYGPSNHALQVPMWFQPAFP